MKFKMILFFLVLAFVSIFWVQNNQNTSAQDDTLNLRQKVEISYFNAVKNAELSVKIEDRLLAWQKAQVELKVLLKNSPQPLFEDLKSISKIQKDVDWQVNQVSRTLGANQW